MEEHVRLRGYASPFSALSLRHGGFLCIDIDIMYSLLYILPTGSAEIWMLPTKSSSHLASIQIGGLVFPQRQPKVNAMSPSNRQAVWGIYALLTI